MINIDLSINIAHRLVVEESCNALYYCHVTYRSISDMNNGNRLCLIELT